MAFGAPRIGEDAERNCAAKPRAAAAELAKRVDDDARGHTASVVKL
jgi:hypothetical protein